MHALRREFVDGPDRPDLVLIHGTAVPAGTSEPLLARFSTVVPESSRPGRREVRLFFHDSPDGGPIRVRYFFSSIRSGEEWFSPAFELLLPDPEAGSDLLFLEEEEGGNLRPAPGRGTFRLPLPLREGEPSVGNARYGFGAMRKKPSESLCRASLPLDGKSAPVIEVPEALSVLKERPMPFFLYHVTEGGRGLVADKINSARITWKDEVGDVVCARMLWCCGSWEAPNLASMEAKKFPPGGPSAAGYPFAEDRAEYLRRRAGSLAAVPLPRTFEGYLFGPDGSDAEYCFLLLRLRPDGTVAAEWRNRDGSNWTIRL